MSGMSVVPYQSKQKKISTLPAIDAKNDIPDPLDFSFCRLNRIEDAADEEPRKPYLRKNKHQVEEEGDKSNSRCLRLNNNNLTDITKLSEIIETKFDNPSNIAWIDLSFNELTTVDPALCEITGMQILYLHGNQISDVKEVEKLSSLQNLRKLTLHGNALEKIKGYRQHILSLLPQLDSLDFSRVTKCDRRTADTWNKMNNAANKKKKTVSEDDD